MNLVLTQLQDIQNDYGRLRLYVNGQWIDSVSEISQSAYDPAKGNCIAKVPFATRDEVNQAVASGEEAFNSWRELPMPKRVQYLYRMKYAFENHIEELAIINTQNHGKTIEESRGDVRRMIDNIEAAISAGYTIAKGEQMDQIASGIDETLVKEPLGVFGVIAPFNFPLMIPFWFIPYALVVGCTLVVKPSEITPLPMDMVMKIIEKEVDLPPGVLNMVHGSREVVENIICNKTLQGVTFVGSTSVAKYVYKLAGEQGKRVISNGGAKNFIVVMPDADLDRDLPSIVSSFFGNTGQRCLAGANLLPVGDIGKELIDKFTRVAESLNIGYGLDNGVDLGPMVTNTAKERAIQYADKGLDEGARVVLDGRRVSVEGYENGFFIGPTILDEVSMDMSIAKEEIFGPVTNILHTNNLDSAIEMINGSTSYGNMACIYTSSGRIAREFRRRVNTGNVGINIGVAAPIAFFPFGGRRESFYGVIHPQIETIDFFTDRKIIVSRW